MAETAEDARKELDKEFMQVRENLKTVKEKFDKVLAAGPEDDVSALLEELEDTVKKVRTGGLIGGGAKGHRKAREAYFELTGKKL